MTENSGPHQDSQPCSVTIALGAALIGCVAGLWVAGWITLALGGAITAVLIVAAPLFAVALAKCAGPVQSQRTSALVAAGALTIAAASCAFVGGFHDVSWDGQAYQQEAVLRLVAGWNPLHDGALDIALRPDDVWINHYPKGLWIAQAVLLRVVGRIEVVKGLSLVLVAASGLLAVAALLTFDIGRRRAVVLGALAAANPVALTQVFSFYVDGALGALVLSAVALSRLWWVKRQPGLLVVVAVSLALLANVKFTGVVYASLFAVGVCAITYFVDRKWPWPLAASALGGISIGALILGANPYFTNLRDFGHPFHPLMGHASVDIITPHATAEFLAMSRAQRLVVATFASSSNQRKAPTAKVPLAVSAKELEAFAYPDTRIGGFGPWFGAALVLALFGGALTVAAMGNIKLVLPVAAALMFCLLTVLINPACWWARYVPQLWLFSVGSVALLIRRERQGHLSRIGAWVQRAAVGVMAGNVLLVAMAALSAQVQMNRVLDQSLNIVARRAAGRSVGVQWNGFESNRQRLLEFGIVTHTNPDACVAPYRLPFSKADVCLDASDQALGLGQPEP